MDIIYQNSFYRDGKYHNGELYQSGAMEIPGVAKSLNTRNYIHCPIVVEGLLAQGITMIALTAHGFQPQIKTAIAGTSLEVLHIPFHDRKLEGQEIDDAKIKVLGAAQKMADAIAEGRKVLSTCWAGINRSSLLTAHTLMLLEPQWSTEEIITLIRTRRSENCLNNALFKQVVKEKSWHGA